MFYGYVRMTQKYIEIITKPCDTIDEAKSEFELKVKKEGRGLFKYRLSLDCGVTEIDRIITIPERYRGYLNATGKPASIVIEKPLI
jgi:hypothetical protein